MNSFLINFQKIAIIITIVIIIAIYFFINPATTSFGFQCLFYKTTGLYCPGCGGQRAFYHLLHGDFTLAFQDNLLIFMVLPLVGIKLYEEFFEKKVMPQFIYSPKFLAVLIIFVIIFTVLRNLFLEELPKLTP